eukprot:4664968-Amphidinium_carterae.1
MLREIEASWSLWHHVTLDRTENSVSWFLPTSKTDPQALGCTRTGGRVQCAPPLITTQCCEP